MSYSEMLMNVKGLREVRDIENLKTMLGSGGEWVVLLVTGEKEAPTFVCGYFGENKDITA